MTQHPWIRNLKICALLTLSLLCGMAASGYIDRQPSPTPETSPLLHDALPAGAIRTHSTDQTATL
jgi:hypothetical protein